MQYRRLELNLDNDEAGMRASEAIVNEYPQFNVVNYAYKFKDFNDYYMSSL